MVDNLQKCEHLTFFFFFNQILMILLRGASKKVNYCDFNTVNMPLVT